MIDFDHLIAFFIRKIIKKGSSEANNLMLLGLDVM